MLSEILCQLRSATSKRMVGMDLLDILASMARDQVTTTHHYSHTIYLAWLVLVSAVSRPQWMLMDPTLVEPTAVRLK